MWKKYKMMYKKHEYRIEEKNNKNVWKNTFKKNVQETWI